MDQISSPLQSDPDDASVRRRWDRRRRVDPRLLAMQFVVCVGSWTALVFMLDGAVKRDGFISSVITGGILTVASWAMTKLGWNNSGLRPDHPDHAMSDREPPAQVVGE